MKAAVFLGLSCLGITSFLLFSNGAQPEPIVGDKEDVEVQARGPVHEAFAQPTAQKQEASAPIAKKPPEPVEELPPDQKPDGDDVQWIPGYFAWDEDRDDFLWVSGIWRSPPPERQWVPGYWQETSGGWRWVSGYWGMAASTTIEIHAAPPEPIAEAVPPPLSSESVYVPGIWVHQQTRYLWRPGHWIALRPGWVWTPAHYCWTPVGYVFVNGYWDHDLHHRGLCFAPVHFHARLYQRGGWAYRPRHVVRVDFMLGGLFVHLGRNHYHFGDYYDAGYARRGFVPWVDFRVRTTAYDPLFGYYRWQNRNQARWEADLRAVYVTRRDNQAARPPRTLALQDAKKIDAQARVIAPLEQLKPAQFKLTAVTKAQSTEIQKNTREWRTLSQARGRTEASAKPATKTGAPLKIELPKTALKAPASKKTPPPLPETPKIQDVKDKGPKDDGKDKSPKDKLPKDLPIKDKTPKDDFKDKSPKDKLPKDLPIKDLKDKGPKDKFPKDLPMKDKGPKDDIKDKGPKDKSPKDKLPKDLPTKDKFPKDDLKDKGPKDKSPKDLPTKDKGPKDDPKEKKPKEKDKDKDKDKEKGKDKDKSNVGVGLHAAERLLVLSAGPPRRYPCRDFKRDTLS